MESWVDCEDDRVQDRIAPRYPPSLRITAGQAKGGINTISPNAEFYWGRYSSVMDCGVERSL